MPCLLRQTDYRRGTSRQYACDNKANQERQSLHTQTKDKRNGKHNNQMDSRYMDARYRLSNRNTGELMTLTLSMLDLEE